MPKGGAYVYDAWQTSKSYNPNIVLLAQHQDSYGVVEGGSGRLTVLDHPLHIALFEHNFRGYLPPHQRYMATGNWSLPPESHTHQYTHRLDTVLLHTHGA
jgi:hypothetical protein